jgi:pimeloyl-ACP methyl ester carboxylesterase
VSIAAWVERTDARHLSAVRGKVLIPGDDRVLDPESMRASAELAGDRLEIVTVPGSSHFVLFDEPRLFDLPRARGRWRTGYPAHRRRR